MDVKMGVAKYIYYLQGLGRVEGANVERATNGTNLNRGSLINKD